MRHRTGQIAGAQRPRKWRAFCSSSRVSARRHDDRLGTPDQDLSTDSGFTLIEVVMTIVLIAMTILPILDATFTSVRASTTVREIAEIETVLQNAADRVNRAPTYCDYTVYVQAAVLAKGWDPSQASATYMYYAPGASALAADAGTWELDPGGSACPAGVRTPRLIQMVIVSIRNESGSINRSIKVVKSDV